MYLCIDFGGTKTAVASVDNDGNIVHKTKIKTDHNYEIFMKNLTQLIKREEKHNAKLACMSVPGLIDRKKGVVHSLGNLPWFNKPIRSDLEKQLDGVKVIIENDAKLGGLGEARAVSGKYKRILYVTIGTGIGGALIVNNKLSEDMQDMEIGKMPLSYKNSPITHWENIISGRSIYSDYGMKASDITDDSIWEEIGLKLAYGLGAACSTLQPQVIIFGGGIGQYADKFTTIISKYLESELHSISMKPEAYLPPKYIEDSVLKGCYEYIKDYAN